MVEAARDGWWYSAWLPGGWLIVAYMTDADLLPRKRACLCEHWRKQLEQTTHTQSRLSAICLPSELTLRLCAANSSRLDHVSGVRWLAIGDAAMAFDPLSSQGIVYGLKSGLLAAQAITEHQAGNPATMEQFARWNAQRFHQYLEMRFAHYIRETRWPASEFWRRRQQP
jgi:2-polyprenyl-6-methoxyphenol hydroxylase-like FAD-dependent oxidoreductase